MFHLAVSFWPTFRSLDKFQHEPENRSMDAGHVDSVDWLFDLRYLQTLPRRTAIYDLARKSRNGRASQYPAFPGDVWHAGPRRYFTREIFRRCLHHLLLLQSVLFALETDPSTVALIVPRLLALLSLHCSLELFVGLLDSSKQCQG